MKKTFFTNILVTVIFSVSLFALNGCDKNKTQNNDPMYQEEQNLNRAITEFKGIPHPSKYSDEINDIISYIQNHPLEFIHDINIVIENDNDGLLIIADKRNYLAEDYVPEDLVPLVKNNSYPINRIDLSLRKPVADALLEMADNAKNEGVTLLVSSTYRSYAYQKQLYERNVKQLGKEVADRESAQPGTSQHQLGTAIDFGSITDDYAETKAGKWLFENASKYGFTLSFPDGYEPITGYRWECWHYRFVGKKAAELQEKWFKNVQQYMIEFISCYMGNMGV